MQHFEHKYNNRVENNITTVDNFDCDIPPTTYSEIYLYNVYTFTFNCKIDIKTD